MVREIKKGNDTLYICDICELVYKERIWAEKCEQACDCNT